MWASSTKTLDFSDLPLIGVHVRLFLRRPIQFDFLSVANMVSEATPRFTRVNPFPIRETAGEDQHLPMLGAVPALEFFHQEEHIQLVVNERAITCDWRADREYKRRYPRFGRLFSELEQIYKMIDRQQPGALDVKIISMSYENFIPMSQEATRTAPKRILSRDYVPRPLLESQEAQELLLSWKTSEGIDRRLEFAKAEVVNPDPSTDKIIGFNLNTVSGVFLSQGQMPFDVLNRVHDDLISFFDSLITPEAKNDWGLRNGKS